MNKADFFIWVVTAFVGVLADLDIGLLVGMIFSMITVLAVGQLAKGTLLGRAEKEDMIMSLDRQGVRPVPGVRIFRWVCRWRVCCCIVCCCVECCCLVCCRVAAGGCAAVKLLLSGVLLYVVMLCVAAWCVV